MAKARYRTWARSWRGLKPIADSRTELFEHPRTGILLPDRACMALD